MPTFRPAFEPTEVGPSRLIRTAIGLITAIALLGGATALLVLASPNEETATAQEPASDLYLSAASGTLSAEEDGQEGALQPGENLKPGTIYRAGADSTVLLRSTRGDIGIQLDAGTSAAAGGSIDPVMLTLLGGRAVVRTGAGEGLRAAIGLGAAEALVSADSVVRLQQSPESAVVEVREGAVELNIGGDSRTVAAGETGVIRDGVFSLVRGSHLPAPHAMLPTPGAMFRKIAGQPLPVQLEWSAVDGASTYLVEIASDVLFRRMLARRSVDETGMPLADVREGRYYWRVTALEGDRAGAASRPITFIVRETMAIEDETVSAPNLKLEEASAQSNLVSIRGQTEPGAHVIVYMEFFGELLTEPREVLVSPTGTFRVQLEAPEQGEISVIAEAFYRPENVTRVSSTVFVDF